MAPSAPPVADEKTAHGLFKAPAANDARSQPGGVADDAQRRLMELRVQSRGLWSDSSDKQPAVLTPRVQTLPKAVSGVTSLTPPTGLTRPVSVSTPTPSTPTAASMRPEISIDSDAPTSPPSLAHQAAKDAASVAAADGAWVSERPTDVRKSLRAVSMGPTRPSEEPTPEVNRRATPVVPGADEASSAQGAPADAPTSHAGSAELTPGVLAQAVQHGVQEAARRSGTRRAVAVLVACVLLLALGLVFGLWPTPWSRSSPRNGPAASEPHGQAAPSPGVGPSAAPAQPQPSAAPAQPQPTAVPAPLQPTAAPAPPQPTAAAAQPQPAEAPAPPPPAAAAIPSAHAAPAAALSVADGLRAARGYLRSKDPAAAEAVLRPLVEQNPEDHHIAELLVQALIDQRRGSEAASLAQRIIKKRPKRAVYRVLLGDALRVSGAMNGANAAWREALELEPDNKEALRRLNQQ